MNNFYTRSDLVTRTLGVLGVREAGQAPSAEDYSTVDGYVESTLDALNARELVYIASPDAIPSSYMDSLCAILAYATRREFSVVGDEEILLRNSAQEAEANLRIMQKTQQTYELMKAEYF